MCGCMWQFINLYAHVIHLTFFCKLSFFHETGKKEASGLFGRHSSVLIDHETHQTF